VTGAEYIAEFVARLGARHVYTLTGGACAFILDAMGRHPALEIVCVQNEQAAAMAADATWRISRVPGVTVATSGPGAMNLISGIACSYFDSIPSIHITGQVNQRESTAIHGANVRQSGFQETRIAEMVRPITKYAVMVHSVDELRSELAKACSIAVSGRMGPVLIDVPMDIQQAQIEADFPDFTALAAPAADEGLDEAAATLSNLLQDARRPVVLWGGGVVRAGVEEALSAWLERSRIPFVSSWAGLSGFSHGHPGFAGQTGVYGNRGANFVLQNAGTVIAFGSRLDNRQRSGNAANFATGAKVHVIDVDPEEIRKYGGGRYSGSVLDLKLLPRLLDRLPPPDLSPEWTAYVAQMKATYRGSETSSLARRLNSLSPYDVVRRLNAIMDEDAVIIGDTGAALCWLYQAFEVKRHTLFTAGGNSPMGYSLCAAIGAKMAAPERQVICYAGDGGFQVNIQELQTIAHYGLDIPVVVMNNASYGIIRQFQDSYLGSRYTASSIGYSTPDFGAIARAYGLRHARVEHLSQLTPELLNNGAIVIEVVLPPETLIEPKLEMGRPINDQFPYLPQNAYEEGNRFVAYPRPAALAEKLREG
jgi:acetolactate synthase-1/2/3 large subunit